MTDGPDSRAGLLAGRYALERPLGSGGMATVYLARDETLGRRVAVKVLRGGLSGWSGEEAAVRFRREGRTAARLSHANIVPVYDAGEAKMTRPEDPADGEVEVSYIVMEYVEGGDLADLLQRRGTLDVREAAAIGAAAADALAHAHGRGVIHRDVKPHNILLDPAGRPRLTDFGIARALEATQATKTGNFLGTALYSAPEQLRGRKVSGAADVYSLGITLYRAVTGKLPFEGGSVMEIARRHISETPPPPREVAPKLAFTEAGREISETILACLSKNPEDRPSAGELAERLFRLRESRKTASGERAAGAAAPATKLGQDVAPAAQTRRTSRPDRPLRRRRRAGAVAVLIVLAAAGLLGGLRALDTLGGEERAASDRPAGSEAPAQVPSSPESQVSQEPAPGPEEGGTGSGASSEEVASVAPESEGGSETGASGNEDSAVTRPVLQMYDAAVSGDYAASYATLTEGFRQRVAPTEAYWSGQYETLESLEFIEGPEATVTGDTATVYGVTRAVHTDRTERNTARWTLVIEDGEWKVDDLSILRQEIL
ncbi:serine/threonine-protein kinase [Rubrobacter radiotolerans]|nr:serine/threonine-protein kinase [Rubrobacter radiotolerans]MDX5894843.1 serine/threonine-protein kinase [Rubrobacter radiotolerans]SMC06886.1 serine/threonine protein kinase [Rubrobacter radiotolerans DSM 5868]